MKMVSLFTKWGILMRLWLAAAFRDSTNRDSTANCDMTHYGFLSDRYSQTSAAEKEANVCVFLARDSLASGTEVEIKISKKTNKWSKSWKKSCTQAKSIHEKACEAGGEAKVLVQRYIPTCLEGGINGGKKNKTAYVVMHATSGKGIDEKRKEVPEKGSAPVFAQMVGALAAMHGVGFSHNHLKEKNAVILDKKVNKNGKELPLVAFIDFNEVVPLKKETDFTGYKDEIFLAEEAYKLARCPKNAAYPLLANANVSVLSVHIEALFGCLKEKWDDATKNPDKQFFDVFKQVILEAWDHQQWPPLSGGVFETKVLNLYHTNFIQANQPALQQLFPSEPYAKCVLPRKTNAVPVEKTQEQILADVSTTDSFSADVIIDEATTSMETAQGVTTTPAATTQEDTAKKAAQTKTTEQSSQHSTLQSTSVGIVEGVATTPAAKSQEDTKKAAPTETTEQSTEKSTVQSTPVGVVEGVATTPVATIQEETTKKATPTESTEQSADQSTSVGTIESAITTPGATLEEDITNKFTVKETTKQSVEKVTEQVTTTAKTQTTKNAGKRQMVCSTLFLLLLLGPAMNHIRS